MQHQKKNIYVLFVHQYFPLLVCLCPLLFYHWVVVTMQVRFMTRMVHFPMLFVSILVFWHQHSVAIIVSIVMWVIFVWMAIKLIFGMCIVQRFIIIKPTGYCSDLCMVCDGTKGDWSGRRNIPFFVMHFAVVCEDINFHTNYFITTFLNYFFLCFHQTIIIVVLFCYSNCYYTCEHISYIISKFKHW